MTSRGVTYRPNSQPEKWKIKAICQNRAATARKRNTMHNNIFEIKNSKDEPNTLTDNNIDPCVLASFGIDYTDSIPADAVKEAIKDLKSYCGDTISVNVAKKCITVKDKLSYFKENYKCFSEILTKLGCITPEQFARTEKPKTTDADTQYLLWMLDTSYSDKTGMLVSYEGDLMPLPEFIREYASDGSKFFIGNVIDFHF